MKKILIILILNIFNLIFAKITKIETQCHSHEWVFLKLNHDDLKKYKDYPKMSEIQLNELRGRLFAHIYKDKFMHMDAWEDDPNYWYSFEDNTDLAEIFRIFSDDGYEDFTLDLVIPYKWDESEYTQKIELKYTLYDFLDYLDYVDKITENCAIL